MQPKAWKPLVNPQWWPSKSIQRKTKVCAKNCKRTEQNKRSCNSIWMLLRNVNDRWRKNDKSEVKLKKKLTQWDKNIVFIYLGTFIWQPSKKVSATPMDQIYVCIWPGQSSINFVLNGCTDIYIDYCERFPLLKF